MQHEEASRLYLIAVDHEKNRRFDEAIKCYKNAIQMVPDIEYRIHDIIKETADESNSEISANLISRDDEKHDFSGDDYDPTEPLIERIQRFISYSDRICSPNKPQQSVHISVLPAEMVLNIFRWVVSDELDLHSLEKCSAVCRGFYLCARDATIWKAACKKIWNNVNESSHFTDWRSMYINGLRIGTDGCYIGESRYYRDGENSFLDKSSSSSKPCYLVQYYRYLRFFVDGTVLILNTADPPLKSIHLLKKKPPTNQNVFVGTYEVSNNLVFVKYGNCKKNDAFSKGRFILNYTMVFWLKKCTSHNVKVTKLAWKNLSVNYFGVQSYNECIHQSDNNKLPPLIFSRVRSYNSESENSL